MVYRHPKTPDWFDNANYEEAINLSSSDWFYLLADRSQIYDFVFSTLPQIKELIEIEGIDEFYYVKLLNQYIENPTGENTLSIRNFKRDFDEAGDLVETPRVGEMSDYASLVGRMSDAGDFATANPVGKGYGEPFSYARVNLSGTKKKIIDDFKKWLQNEMDSINACGREGFEVERRSLIDSRVLQYLDVLLYTKLNGINLTHEEYAGIVFPFEAGADKIRKTTKPKAEQAISEVYCNWLQSLNVK